MCDYKDCTLCPRNCHGDRSRGTDFIGDEALGQPAEPSGRVSAAAGKPSFCMAGAAPCREDQVILARAALHMWEEPCISGEAGSGAVFFTGCNLRCAFCQNADIALGSRGKVISLERFEEDLQALQKQGANNLNLVTPGHMLPQIVRTLKHMRENKTLKVPVVYNTSSYERVEALKQLDGLVQVYLPDMKYMRRESAKLYSHAPDYVQVAIAAIDEMVRQVNNNGGIQFDEKGIMTNGVIVRHLVLPGHTAEAKEVVRFLHERYSEQIYISIMNQYTPCIKDTDPVAIADSDLLRKVTPREYNQVVNYAIKIGVEQGFIQEGETAQESFIPSFSEYTGV